MTVHELRQKLEGIDDDLELYMEIDYYSNHDSWGQPSMKMANVDAVQTVYGVDSVNVEGTVYIVKTKPDYAVLRNILP